ncbi:MAG: IPT/TIG domain-containing protein [Pseudomonadota bacterium]
MFDAITRACRWARETVFKPQPGQARATEAQPSRDIARPRGRRPAALITSILGFAMAAGLASGAAAQAVPTGSASLSDSTIATGTPFTLTIQVTQNDPGASTNTYIGALGSPNSAYALPSGVTVSSSTPVTNDCNLFLNGVAAGSGGFSALGSNVPQGTTCTLAVRLVASTAGVKSFSNVGSGLVVGGVGFFPTGDLGSPGSITAIAPPVPAVTSLSSVYGSIAGGQTLYIDGTDLTGVTGVTIGGTAATGIVVDSATQIHVTTPAHAAGLTDVRVTTGGGTSANTSADDFTYLAPPTLSIVISPSSGLTTDSATMTMTVTNPNSVALTQFGMTGIPFAANFGLNGPPTNGCGGNFTSGSSGINSNSGNVPANGTCVITAPVRGFAAGVYTVSIASTFANPGGLTGAGATSNTYTVTPPAPSVSAVTAHARVTGGNSIVITGSDLTGATAVTFDGVNATSYVVNSNSQITAVAPAHAMGVVDIRVTTPGGTTANTAADDITYVAPPTASLVFSPSSVVTLQNSTLTITLTNPNPTVALTRVAMAPIPGPDYLGLNSTIDTTCGGAGGLSYGPAGLSTGGYTVPAGGSCTYTMVMRGFQPNTYQFSVGTIQAIDQGNPTGPGATSNVLTVNPAAPTVTAVSPTSGPLAGGGSVVITGTNFSSVSGVTFGGVAAAHVVNSTTQITATAPAGSGTVDVQVTNVTGTSATSAADQYTYVAAPSVTGDPSNTSVNAGSTTTFTASASGSPSVQWQVSTDGSGSAFVDISNTPGAYAGATTNTLTVTGQMSRHLLLYRAVFTNAGGSGTSANATLSVVPTPPVVSVTLSDTTILAGQTTTLTLSMTNPNDALLGGVFGFAGNPNFQNYALPAGVTVSGVGAINCGGSNSFSGDQGQALWLQLPANSGTTCSTTVELTSASSGTYNLADVGYVLLTNGASVTGSVSVPALTVVATPIISTISPQAGPVAGGTSVNITGSNFTPASTVSFGGTPGTSVSFISATALSAVSPAGSGTIDVSVTNIAGTSANTSADDFTYVERPEITLLGPPTGPEAGGTNVLIVGSNFTPDVAVTFGGVSAASITYVSTNQLFVQSPAGTGTVDVRVSNTGGITDVVPGVQFTYVPRPSAPVINSPTNGSFINSYPTVSGTADPNTFVNLFLNGSPLTSVNADGSGNWAVPGVLNVPEGEHTLRASVTTDGGTSPDSNIVTFTFDSTAPNAPVIDAPADGSATTNRSPTYTGTAEANAAIEVTVSSNFVGTTTADGTGAWSITEPTILAVGSHVVQARATDAAGNQSNYSGGNTFTVYVEPNLSINDVTVTEGNVANFTVSLDGPAGPGGVTFDVNVAPGTASVSDFIAPPLTGLTIPEGQSSHLVSINAVDDALYELSETFTATVANVTGAVVADAEGVGTITNDDTAPAFTINDVTMSEGSAGTTAFTFTVAKTGDTQLASTVNFATADGTATVAGNDYFATSGTLTFNPSDTAHSVTVAVSGDLLYENNEAFFVNLSSAVDAGISDGQGVGTIVNDDAMPFLSVNDVTLNEGNAGTTAFVFTASLSAPSALAVTVDYGTVGLTATDGSDYSAPSGTFTFAPGETIKTATVLVNGDTTLEPDETFAFNLSAASNASFADNQGLGTIVNDDVAPPSAPVTTTPANGLVTSDNHPTISGTSDPGVIIDVIIDGASVGTTASNGGGNWFFSSYAPLSEGPHTVRSVATNSGGPSPSSNTNTFTVDSVAPAAPVVTAPANGSSTTNLNPVYTGTAEPASTVTVAVDGSAIGTTTADGSGNWSLTQPTPLTLAAHTVRASAADAAGNSSPNSGTNTFTVVPFAPVTGAVSATVAYGSSANPITLNLSGGSADSVAIAVQATNGVATASGASITYTPAAGYAGPDSFTYTATNAGGTSSPATATITVSMPTLTLNPATVPAATVGTAYSQTLTASGGAAPYSYARTAGALPAGLTLSAGGVLSGTPTAGGTFNFTVTATDSSNGPSAPFTTARAYSLNVAAPTISVSPMSTTATVGASFSNTFSAIGGTGPYSFAITAGALPAGMTLASNGQLTGTPTAGGTFNFTITATDSSTGTGAPYSGSRAYSLPVAAATIVLPTASLPAGAVTVPYSGQLPAATGGTAPYSYAFTAGDLPPGVTLSPTGALSGTPTGGGTFFFNARATDSSTGSGPYSTTQTYSIAIAAPAVTVGPTTLPDGTKAIAYSQVIAASGGVAPYSYAVTAGVLPNGLTLSPSTGVLSGTPSDNGTFNFTVTATDSATGNGPYAGSRAYSLFIALDPPTANPVSVSVAYGSADNPVTLNLTGGAANSLAIGTAPAHGTATVSGLSITYTPAAGYFGADSFTYTATNGSGTSVPATVTVTVGLPPAPTATGTSVSVPYASAGTAIDLTSRVAGVSTGVSVASAPSHGTTSIAGYVITYTPAAGYFGADSFTYTANGPGGSSAPATVSLSVATPPPPVVTPTPPTPVPPTTGGSSTVDLQTQVGGVVTGWRITIAPIHGAAVIEGAGPAPAPAAMPGEGPQATGPALSLRYTPTAGFMGTDTVTLVAEGPGGDSAPVTFTFQVPGMAPNRTATVASNAVSTIDTTSGLTGGPFNSVQITRAPGFGTAVVSGLNIVFTPGAANNGPTYLEYTITTPGGVSAVGRIDYTVNRAPGAQTLVVSTPAGRPVTVSLTANAVGGPFTGAAIVNLSIPTAGAAVLTQGGTAGNRTYDLTFTPAGTFTGRVDVNFTLTNAFATEGGVVQVTVTSRPDPSMDPDVRGLVSSQVDSALRFADTQISNFHRRLEQIRDGDNDSASNLSLNLNMGGANDIDPRAAARRRLGDQQASEDGLSLMETRARDEEADAFAQFGGRGGLTASVEAMDAPALGAAPSRSQGEDAQGGHSVGVWAGGGIDWGRREADGQRDTRFTTSGVSAGVDVKLTDALIVGAGLGYGDDRTRIGSNDTTSDGTSTVGALYAAWQAPNDIHLEGVFGYGSLDYDSKRWSTAASAFAFGERSGDMTFGSIGLAQEHRSEGMNRSLYARIDAQSVTLDGFTETGAGIYALTYDALEFDALSSTVGMRMDWRIQSRDSLFAPSLRFEWAHQFDEVGSQTVSYADWLASPRYGLELDSWARNRFALDLEGRWVFENMELTAGYRGTTSSDTISHGVQVKLSTRF